MAKIQADKLMIIIIILLTAKSDRWKFPLSPNSKIIIIIMSDEVV